MRPRPKRVRGANPTVIHPLTVGLVRIWSKMECRRGYLHPPGVQIQMISGRFGALQQGREAPASNHFVVGDRFDQSTAGSLPPE